MQKFMLIDSIVGFIFNLKFEILMPNMIIRYSLGRSKVKSRIKIGTTYLLIFSLIERDSRAELYKNSVRSGEQSFQFNSITLLVINSAECVF